MKKIILIGLSILFFLVMGICGIFLLVVIVNGLMEGYINPLDILVLLLIGAASLFAAVKIARKIKLYGI